MREFCSIFVYKKEQLDALDYRFYYSLCNIKLDLISDGFDHLGDGWIEWEFWHFRIDNHEHISRFSIGSSSFSRDLELRSWLGAGFYLEGEDLVVYGFHR